MEVSEKQLLNVEAGISWQEEEKIAMSFPSTEVRPASFSLKRCWSDCPSRSLGERTDHREPGSQPHHPGAA